MPPSLEPWPALPLEAWSDTCATLHLWTQIVGKIRLAQSPWVNHGWSVTLYVTPRGLTTSPIPYGTRVFQIDFDFLDHRLLIQASDGGAARFPCGPSPSRRSTGDSGTSLAGSTCTSGSARRPTRWRTRFRSRRTSGTPRTTRSTRTGSGACCCSRTGSSSDSGRASPASAARFISSGARPTSR